MVVAPGGVAVTVISSAGPGKVGTAVAGGKVTSMAVGMTSTVISSGARTTD